MAAASEQYLTAAVATPLVFLSQTTSGASMGSLTAASAKNLASPPQIEGGRSEHFSILATEKELVIASHLTMAMSWASTPRATKRKRAAALRSMAEASVP
mmetsp:Transcript_5221/g.9536  ORF Transcript_5221/g.9536 Transcript_5221/m.9536 type:complete len:100 (-) Transcript_5221:342-641(-)